LAGVGATAASVTAYEDLQLSERTHAVAIVRRRGSSSQAPAPVVGLVGGGGLVVVVVAVDGWLGSGCYYGCRFMHTPLPVGRRVTDIITLHFSRPLASLSRL
jgi:hypothetical protein